MKKTEKVSPSQGDYEISLGTARTVRRWWLKREYEETICNGGTRGAENGPGRLCLN